MKIRIDNRERSLIKLMKALKNQYEFNHLEIVVEKLDLGDIIIENKKGDELLVIERKSLNDLAEEAVVQMFFVLVNMFKGFLEFFGSRWSRFEEDTGRLST